MGRYWDIVKESYRHEKERAASRVEVDEKDFLPAALEILERPASPLGRFTIWVICVFFALALAWSIVGKVDVVAVAQGKITPIGQTKTIQSFEHGVIQSIFVRDGLKVEKGQVLLELDSTMNGADIARLKRELRDANIVIERDQWLITAFDSAASPDEFTSQLALGEADVRLHEQLATSNYQEYHAARESLLEKMKEKRAELAVAREELAQTELILPLLEEQVSALEELSAEGIASRFQFLQKKEELLSRLSNLNIQKDRLAQIQSALRSLESQIEQHYEEAKSGVIEELVEAKNKRATILQELVKAEEIAQLLKIRAPVSGVVQQLAVHTVGGVVKSGDPLMIVVPEERELEANVVILNKDVGFVEVGQKVELKLEAFPFTKYGVIHGELSSIGQDAIQDEKLGLVYPARISMIADNIVVDQQPIALGPGMGLTAEIKIGRRRLVEFILAPLFRYKDESLRER